MDKELDMDLMAEAELGRLQRQYRIMEGDRKAFMKETSIKLAKQRQMLAALRKEHRHLLEELRVASAPIYKRRDDEELAHLTALMDKYQHTCRDVNSEQLKLNEIEQQIKKTEKQISKLQKREICDNDYRERIKSGQNAVKILENKLETIIKRFCGTLTDNKKLRLEIDHLLKERTRFNAMWEHLLQDLNGGKKFMLDLVEQATIAYDQREEWCSKLQALKIRAHNDSIVHTQDMREMQRQLDHDGKLREFLTIKGQRRVMKDLQEKEQRRRDADKQAMEKQVDVYRATLEKIRMICDETELERISAKFLKQEEENFALFNYVNELNQELEQLNDAIADIETKIDEQQKSNQEQDDEQLDNLKSLNAILDENIKQANEDEELLKTTQNELNEVLEGIKRIFNLLNCDWAPILDLLGTGQAINSDNVMIFLGLIQKNISVLITDAYFTEKSLLKIKKNRKNK